MSSSTGCSALAAEPREREQVVDQRAHALGFALDDPELALRLGVELPRRDRRPSSVQKPLIARIGARRSCDTE